jgi:hypothetical protein
MKCGSTWQIHSLQSQKKRYVPDLEQDLLAGRELIMSKDLTIMDEDQTNSGIFPVVNNEIKLAMGFSFADSNGQFYIESVPLSESKYASMSGCKLWHRIKNSYGGFRRS